MAALATPEGAPYCIDTTEVTQGHFADFLSQAAEIKPTWPEFCEGTKLQAPALPDDDSLGNCGQFYKPGERPNAPMVCVNWCQAYAYCQWAGKHLCGKVGGGGASKEGGADANESEWYNACSSGGKAKYPYGDDFVAGKCTDEAWLKKKYGDEKPPYNSIDHIPDVGASSECHGAARPFDLVVDLSGSVAEWEDSVILQTNHNGARIRGGYMLSQEQEQSCSEVLYAQTDVPTGGIGFRCCADAR